MVIDESEVWFSFSRSGGPGGQNVNKVSSKVTVHWAFLYSDKLPDNHKLRLQNSALIKPHLDSTGTLSLTCQEARSQAMNRKLVMVKLDDLLRRALVVKKPRKKTRVSKTQIEKRIKYKKNRAERLKSRRVAKEEL